MNSIMFETLLKSELQKLNGKYTLESGLYRLDEMHEASGSNVKKPLGDSILIASKIIFAGAFTPAGWGATTKFLELVSKYNYVDYSHNFQFYSDGTAIVVYSTFPSVHQVEFKMQYDLTTFIESTAGNIHRAAVEWIKINPK